MKDINWPTVGQVDLMGSDPDLAQIQCAIGASGERVAAFNSGSNPSMRPTIVSIGRAGRDAAERPDGLAASESGRK